MRFTMLHRIDNNLRAALDEHERSYAWLARKIGVGRSTVMRWADGLHEPGEDTKARISGILSREVSFLWPGDADASTHAHADRIAA